MSKKDDAWKRVADLHDKFTKQWKVRSDLRVTALAHERTVRFELGDRKNLRGSIDVPIWHDTQRNVSTMRELANALLQACDFVDKHNPEWAGRRTSVTKPVKLPKPEPITWRAE
jgi:hypothetical protein